jgi:spermidine synthase
MKPHLTLAETTTPNGARMTLVAHDGSFCIRVNGQQLMHSAVTTSELELGTLGCEPFAKKKPPARVLIGGLGLGFTLKSVLAALGPSAVVHVAELFPEIVAWNRTHLLPLNGALLADPRVSVFTEDVRAVLIRAARQPYDAILLDIDNGTTAMVSDDNHALYSPAGIRHIAAALRPGGRAAVWSASPDAPLADRLARAGLTVTPVSSRVHATARRSTYRIYLADKPAASPAAGRAASPRPVSPTARARR